MRMNMHMESGLREQVESLRIHLPYLMAFILLIGWSNSFSQSHSFGAKPSWIEDHEYDAASVMESDGEVAQLLYDYQRNILEKSTYIRRAIRFLNNSGVQSYSDVSIGYDPSYQNLVIHEVYLIRDGQRIDKKETDRVSVIQRESSMEAMIYDGHLTWNISLSDVRPYDLLIYSFTLEGVNPLYRDEFFGSMEFNYSVGIHQLNRRVIADPNSNIRFNYINNGPKPQISKRNGLVYYDWELKQVPEIQYDNQVPSWHITQDLVEFTSLKDWVSFDEWSADLYEVSDVDRDKINGLASQIIEEAQNRSKFKALVDFVQNDVRYLGLEEGISAYKPHSPMEVAEQRYGDCKDKSLLLVELLLTQGISAWPVLVNTNLTSNIGGRLPKPGLFDHCIVMYEWDGEEFMVDPTISNQGGDAGTIETPNYGMGYVLLRNSEGLTELPIPYQRRLVIEEALFIKGAGFGDADMEVITKYYGLNADSERESYLNGSRADVQNSYTQFYSNLYPSIEVSKPLEVQDMLEHGDNIFIVKEFYHIPDIWEQSDDDSSLYNLTLYPLNLESILEYPNSPERHSPYATSTRDYQHDIVVHLPESWPITEEEVDIGNEDYSYHSSILYDPAEFKVYLSYLYKCDIRYVEAEQAQDFIADHDRMIDDLGYTLNYTMFDDGADKASGLGILLGVILLLGISYGLYRVHLAYDPEPNPVEQTYGSIGGWIILPLIGLVLTPFRVMYEMNDSGFFDNTIWGYLDLYSFAQVAIIFVEFVFNVFALVAPIFLLWMAFQKRSSFPKLYIAYLLIISVFYPLDLFASSLVMDTGPLTAEENRELVRTFVSAAIWIPYFSVGKRPLGTFRTRLGDKNIPGSSEIATSIEDDVTSA